MVKKKLIEENSLKVLEKSEGKCKKTNRSTLDINYNSEIVGDESLDGNILDELP